MLAQHNRGHNHIANAVRIGAHIQEGLRIAGILYNGYQHAGRVVHHSARILEAARGGLGYDWSERGIDSPAGAQGAKRPRLYSPNESSESGEESQVASPNTSQADSQSEGSMPQSGDDDQTQNPSAVGHGVGALMPLPPVLSYKGHNIQTKFYSKRLHFSVPITSPNNGTSYIWRKTVSNGHNFGYGYSGWIPIPWKHISMYLNNTDVRALQSECLMYRFKQAGFRLSNFAVHQVTLAATGTPTIELQLSAVGYEACHCSARDIGPYIINGRPTITDNTIDEIESKSWLDIKDLFETTKFTNNPSQQYVEYPLRLYQVIQSPPDNLSNSEMSTPNPVFPITNLSNFSTFSLSQPAIREAVFNMPPKEWRNGVGERMTICKTRNDTADIPNPSIDMLYFGQNHVLTGDAAYYLTKNGYDPSAISASTYIKTLNIAPQQFTSITKGGNSLLYTPSDFAASGSTAPSSVYNGAGVNNVNSRVPMAGQLGSQTPNEMNDLYAFKFVIPPNPVDANHPLSIMATFTIEAELEIEYIDSFNGNVNSRNILMSMSNNTPSTATPSQPAEETAMNGNHTLLINPIMHMCPQFNNNIEDTTHYQMTGPEGTDYVAGHYNPI